MKQKNTTPTKEQSEILRRNGYNPVEYVVVKELTYSLIVKHRYSDKYQNIKK